MNPARWDRIKEIFGAALEKAPDERPRLLDQTCGSDDSLRREVERLLAEPQDSWLKNPLEAGAVPELVAGERLGRYVVETKLGQGGMGAVYKAQDTVLRRLVALKILPAGRFADPDSRQRLMREARAASALNHPHIVTIYDIDQVGGIDFIAMEYVAGKTLDQVIPRKGLRLAEALRYAIPVAEALAAAHAAGIVHRDVKPSNVVVSQQGLVKVLDFGLAKLTKPPEIGSEGSTHTAHTAEGMVVGTAAYMSPEQAEGKPVDARSDIFSFGAMLYELVTGRRAFQRDSVAGTLAAVLNHEPAHLAHELSPDLDKLIARCLRKDPARRIQHMDDVKLALEELRDEPQSVALPAHKPWSKRLWVWAAAGFVLTAAGLDMQRRLVTEAPRRVQLSLLPPENGTLLWNAPPAVSPDGRAIAFGAAVEGRSAIWVRELDSSVAQPLPQTEEATTIAWSPDSRSIAFLSPDHILKRVDLANGRARTVWGLPSGFGGASWADDTIVFTDPKGTWRVPANGGMPSVVAALDAETEVWHTNPWCMPDGQHVLFAITGKKAEDSAIYAGDIYSKDPARNRKRILVSGVASFTYAQGHLLYLRGRTLMAQPFDAGRLETSGEPVPVAEQVDNLQGWTRWGVSQNGVLAYTSGAIGLEQLTWYDRSGKILGAFGPAGLIFTPTISPDGSTVAFDMIDESQGSDVWLHDITRGSTSRFTSGYYWRPVWSPDGTNLAYSSRGLAQSSAYQKPRGVGQEQKVGAGWVWDWSSDGRYLISEILNPKTRSDLWVLPLFGDHKAFPYLQTAFDEREGKFSPDGQWVAYASDETGRFEIYVQSFPSPSERLQVSSGGGDFPVWSRDGRELYFVSADMKMMAAEVKTFGRRFQAGVPKALFATRLAELADVHNGIPYDVSRDGRFLVVTPQWTPGKPITVVLNWNVGLKH